MRDVDDADVFRAKLADDLEKLLGFAGGERGRRLVHDDDARVHRERLGDLDHLHLTRRQRRDRSGRREFETHTIEQRGGFGVHVAAAKHGHQPARAFVAEEDIRGDVEVRREHQLLMNESDAVALGFPHVAQNDGLAVDEDFAFVGQVRSPEYFHEGALARAVFAHQGQHFPGLERQRDVLQRDDTRKPLGDAAHREQAGSLGTLRAHGVALNTRNGKRLAFSSGFFGWFNATIGDGAPQNGSKNLLLSRSGDDRARRNPTRVDDCPANPDYFSRHFRRFLRFAIEVNRLTTTKYWRSRPGARQFAGLRRG